MIGQMNAAGPRKLKKRLRALQSDVSTVLAEKKNAHPPTEQRNMPRNHMRNVIAHMLGSSLLDTEALTSGKGLSSCSIATKLTSILRGEKENGLWWVSGGIDTKQRRTLDKEGRGDGSG